MSSLQVNNGEFDLIIANNCLPSGGGDGGYSEFGMAEITEFKTEYVLAVPPLAISNSHGNGNGFIQPLENIGQGSESSYLTPHQSQLASYQKDDLLQISANDNNTAEFDSLVDGTGVSPSPMPVAYPPEEEFKLANTDNDGEVSPHRFENSLITLNDISNYRASGLDWIEGGASNWLNFDQGANFGASEITTNITEPKTPSVCTSSMYNFYDEEEDECQKDFEDMEVDDAEENKVYHASTGYPATIQNQGHISVKSSDAEDSEDEEDCLDEENENDFQTDANSTTKVPKPRRSETCALCNIEFPTPGRFENHMKIVHQEPFSYPCTSCDKKFAKKHQLEAHSNIHDPDRYNKEPQWQCDHCDKKYHVRTTLYSHYRKSHPGLKPLKAEEKKLIKKRNISTSLQQQRPGERVGSSLNKLVKSKRRKSLITTLPTNNTQPRDGESVLKEALPLTPQVAIVPTEDEHPAATNDETSPDSRPGHHPCTFCDKVLTTPWGFREHLMLHTGHKPWKCPYCNESFRLKQTLTYHIQRRHCTKEDRRNILKLLKCRVCGQDDFFMFSKFHSHRTRRHRDVPYDKEKEKVFACGACLKPYFLREDAIVCALLAHDPTHLQKNMFKYKCSKCPDDRPGYYKQALLKKHLEEEHSETINLLEDCAVSWETLPYVRVNKVKAQEIRANGLPLDITFASPLYYDLTEFGPSVKEQHLMATLIMKLLSERRTLSLMDGPHVCTICGTELSNRGNFKRHLTTVHISEEILKQEREEKDLDGPDVEEDQRQQNAKGKKKTFSLKPAAAPSEKEVENIFQTVLSKNKDSEEENNVLDKEEEQSQPVISSFKCKFCDKTFPKKRALHFHEVRGHATTAKSKKQPIRNAASFKSARPAKNAPSTKIARRGKAVNNTRSTKKRVPLPLSSSSCTSSSSDSMDDVSDDDSDDESLFEAVIKDQEKKGISRSVVNVNDVDAVKALLNFQTVQIILPRMKINLPTKPQQPNCTETAIKKETSKIVEAKKLKKKNKELPSFEPVIIVREKKTEINKDIAKASSFGHHNQNVHNLSRPRIVTTIKRRLAASVTQKNPQYQLLNSKHGFIANKTPKIVLRRLKLADGDDKSDD